MVFVTMHLANLALNLISIETADAGLKWLTGPWRSLPGTVVLYGAAAVHVVLVLRTLYLKRTLKMPAREAAQIVLGLLIPLLIAEHVIGTRVYASDDRHRHRLRIRGPGAVDRSRPRPASSRSSRSS